MKHAAAKISRWNLAVCLLLAAATARSATPPFDTILGRPTAHSITLNVLASAPCELVVDYGTEAGRYTASSGATELTPGIPTGLELIGLEANTDYFYRVRYRAIAEAAYTSAPESTFVTQRAAGSSFTFDIEADPHYGDNEPAVWRAALANILGDKPDFLIDLGDTFMDEKFAPTSYTQVDETHRAVRSGYFSLTGGSIPLFLVNGNHDPEIGWALSRTAPLENMATWGVRARQRHFSTPVANAFYSGATSIDPYTGEPRNGYYAWTWGDALLVVLDPYWYTSQATPKTKDPWQWTLGREQYDWLKHTLEQSRAAYKFVFLHNLVGGSHDGIARGGVEFAPYYEWGGRNADGTPGFAAHRPGWPMPIQDLLVANHVSAVFHGHDHLFAKQDLDLDGDGTPELIYQEVPQPSRSNQSTASGIAYGYTNGVLYPSSGHLRVRVTPQQATVAYVRAVISTDKAGVGNGAVQYQYIISPSTAAVPPTGGARLSNLAVRSQAGIGDSTLVVGLVVSSGTPPSFLLRAVGPALSALGVTNPLADPTLSLYAGSTVIASNDNWSDGGSTTSLGDAANSVGAFGFSSGSKDAALVSVLRAGAYTIQVQPKSVGTGIALAEAYVTSTGDVAPLVNASCRGFVGTGEAVLIPGFTISGRGTIRLLVRAIGPTLADFGVSATLRDPTLTLFAGQTVIATNDNWNASAAPVAIREAAAAVGAFPLPVDSKDAALVATLPAGAYTAVVSGADGTTGTVLIEVYVLP